VRHLNLALPVLLMREVPCVYISEYFSLMDLDTTYHDSCNNSVGKILRYQKQILVLKGAIEGSNDYRVVRCSKQTGAMSPQIQRLKMPANGLPCI
jgi:hypothetical protein